MALFRQSTEASLTSTRDAMAAANSKIAELAAERALKLEQDGDPVGEIQRIDTALTTHRNSIVICEARIKVMIERRRQEHRAEFERQKTAAIAQIAKHLQRREAAAAKIESALAEIKATYATLLEADRQAFNGWPDVVRPSYDLHFLSVRHEPYLRAIQPIMEGRAEGLVEGVQKKASLLIEALNEAAIPEFNRGDENEQDAAA